MDNLRNFLGMRIGEKRTYPGINSWDHLTRKIDQLKDQKSMKSVAIKSTADVNKAPVAKGCIEVFCSAANKNSAHALILHDVAVVCDSAIEDLKKLSFPAKREFLKELLNNEATLPLELIWKLHQAQVLQMSSYIFRKIEPKLLSASVVWLLTHSKESKEYSQIATDTFASLILASQSGPVNLQLSSVCSTSIKTCVDDVINWVIKSPESSVTLIDLTYLSSSELSRIVGTDAMERFLRTHLFHLLNNDCSPNTFDTILLAVKMQEKCTLHNISLSYQKLLSAIVKGLGVEKIVNQLTSVLVRPLINWKAILLITAAVVDEYPQQCDSLQKLTDELLQVGLEGGRQMDLSAGFLLARHCCTCDNKSFSSYSVWFSTHFGPDSVSARNPVQFQSLLQFLTDIVPAESVENLRVHINKVPQAPTSCNSILHDYSVLVRTRLADLNESAELAGLFCDSMRDSHSGLDSRQEDVAKVLRHFQQTREIMKPVLEASIFRRQYYHKVFLPDLLSGSESLKGDVDMNVTRHEFILALKAQGKIPDSLFRAYIEKKSSCSDVDQLCEVTQPKRCKKSLKMRLKQE